MIKLLLIFLALASVFFPIADAIPLSDKTGLRFSFPIKTDDRLFTVEATGNLQVNDANFNKNDKSISFDVVSSLENNLLEIFLPTNLIGGDFKFYVDNVEHFPKLNQGKNSLFITLEFLGVGPHIIKLQGTTYLETFDITKKIDYEILNELVTKIESNPATNSLFISLNNTNNIDSGELLIDLTNDVIIPLENNQFVITVDGIHSDYTVDDDILKIKFNQDAEQITIIGSYVIPEFYEIAPLVLATSFIGLIVLRKYKKLFV